MLSAVGSASAVASLTQLQWKRMASCSLGALGCADSLATQYLLWTEWDRTTFTFQRTTWLFLTMTARRSTFKWLLKEWTMTRTPSSNNKWLVTLAYGCLVYPCQWWLTPKCCLRMFRVDRTIPLQSARWEKCLHAVYQTMADLVSQMTK